MGDGSEEDRSGGARERFLLGLVDTLAEGAADDALTKVAALLGAHFGCNRVGYGHLDPDRDTFSYRVCWTDGTVVPLIGELPAHAFGVKIVARLSRGETVVVDDLFADPISAEIEALDTAERVDTRAILVVPFLGAGALRTIVYLNSTAPRRWTPAEVALMEDVAERSRRVAELAAAEARLREREARFAAVFASAITGFTIFDARTNETLEANDRILALTGYSRADFDAGRWQWQEFTPPEFQPYDLAAIDQARKRGWFDPFEKEFRRPDGTRVPVRLSSAPLPGHPGRVVISIEDMTARRAAEQALRISNERFQAAIAAVEGVLWTNDARGRMRGDQPGWEAITGQTFEEYQGYGWARAVHPDDAQPTIAAWEEAVAGRKPFVFEHRVRRSDGAWRRFAIHAIPVQEADGTIREWVGIHTDVTERRAAEARLRDLNAALEARVAEALAERRIFADLVERTDAFVQAIDMDYRWIAINRAAAEEFELIFGVRPKVGDSLLDTLADQPASQAKVKAFWSRVLAGEEFTELGSFGDPGRVRRDYEMKFNVLRDGVGRQIGAFQFVYDVTSRVAEQRRLAEAEDQLRQSQKMEAMGQLTGGVAHDFNNLLTPIIGSLDLLQRKGVGGAREARLIDAALQSADRARTLVQRLLAFARRQALQPVPVDIGAAARDMADLIQSTMGPQIRVTVDVADGIARAIADRNQLEMALLNLCVNARDAMPDGGTIRISVGEDGVGEEARAGLAPGRYVRLSVADTGAGMDEATRARAIEPFFSTKGVGKGTGLGLSMVHGLARQLGGAMTLDSQPGVGTNVELWLPATPDAPAEATDTATTPGQPGPRGLILLVDDEDAVRASTAEIIEEFGFEVVQADSAETALALLDRGCRPALLVTDHLMPGLPGAELARRVRGRADGCPVLVVSGYAEVDSIDPGLPRLAKPFRADELIAAVEDALR